MKFKGLVEQIHKILSGGQSDDSRYSHNEIFVRINQVVASLAKNSAYENAKVEGIFYANDAFTTKISVNVVGSELTLPQLPVMLPRSRGIVSLSSSGLTYVPILLKDEFVYKETFDFTNHVMYYLSGNRIVLLPTSGTILPGSVNIVMVSPFAQSMEEDVPYPPDAVNEVIGLVVSSLSVEKKFPQDIANDGNDLN